MRDHITIKSDKKDGSIDYKRDRNNFSSNYGFTRNLRLFKTIKK